MQGIRRFGTVALASVLAALALGAVPAGSGSASAVTSSVALPPVNATWDYQIGKPYQPPPGVTVVSRDRSASPAKGTYSICYVNAFQTQPDEVRWWKTHHRNLLLRKADGTYVVDSAWGEILLDTRTAAKRTALADIVGGWVDGCAASGFDAVEPDNLDSWTRSGGRLTRADNFRYAALLVGRAHLDGLAIAQKNAAGQVARGVAIGFDFAVAEECARWHECGAYAKAYGDRVFAVEYRDRDFARGCARWGDRLSIIRRDRMVTAPGSRSYVYDSC